MVTCNSIVKSAGNMCGKAARPKKILFDIGDYDVSFHSQGKQVIDRPWQYFRCSIWHRKRLIGGVDLSTAYSDARTVVSVNTNIVEDYQGLGIAYRVYEALVWNFNMALQSSNQSEGAVKLWRRFATNKQLRMYFVDDTRSDGLFHSDIFEVHSADDGSLEGTDYADKPFNPYGRGGSLILVKKNGTLDKSIQTYLPLRRSQHRLSLRFKRFDEQCLTSISALT